MGDPPGSEALRWMRGEHNRDGMDALARQSGGHATLVRGGDRHGEVRGSLPAIERALQKRLKQAFDPFGILNPGRLYSWL